MTQWQPTQRHALAVTIAMTLVLGGPESAKAAGVDEVLAAVAEVVKDRAKEVGRRTLQDQVINQLCDGTVKVKRKDKDDLVLHLGPDECAESASDAAPDKPACSDSLFVRSCKLLDDDVVLTDVTLLRALGAETVSLLIRVGASIYDAPEYEARLYPAVAKFVYDSAVALAKDNGRARALSKPLHAISEAFLQNAPSKLIEALANDAKTKALLQRLNEWKAPACPKDAWCGSWQDEKPLCPDDGTEVPGCVKWKSPERCFVRTSIWAEFEAAFKEHTEFKPCGEKDDKCFLGRVRTNLYNLLKQLECGSANPDKMFRQLAYVISQANVYQAGLPEGSPERQAFDEWVSAAAGHYKREAFATRQLALGLEVVAAFLDAQEADPDGAKRWTELLLKDLSTADVTTVKTGQALGTGTLAGLSPSVTALRHSVKDALALPFFHFVTSSSPGAPTEILTFVKRLAGSLQADATPEKYMAALSDLLDRAVAIADIPDPELTILADTLESLTNVVNSLANEEWVELTIQLSEELEERATLPDEAERFLRFLRLLMAMYEADDKEDAKAIFSAALDDAASRERRYATATVDVAALVGGRGGYQRTPALDDDASAETSPGAPLYGLYAPVGIQVAYKAFGLLLYPIDVGTYLTRSNTKVEVQEAARVGGSLYIRFSSEIPIVFGAGADYKPEIDDSLEQWRAYGHLSLELPLYILH